jgi:hypothetical protein
MIAESFIVGGAASQPVLRRYRRCLNDAFQKFNYAWNDNDLATSASKVPD